MSSTNQTPIGPAWRLGAHSLRAMFTLIGATPKQLRTAPADVTHRKVSIPTRHGAVTCLITAPAAARSTGLPVYVNFHGGAFIVRTPEQDSHITTAVAQQLGVLVVNVDYDTAPAVRYPVAEEQAYDVVAWLQQHAGELGGDPERLAVGGFSAGAKLAINVCQQARDADTPMPLTLVAGYPALDMTLSPTQRTSPAKHPAVSPWLIKLMYATYFADKDRRSEPLASPAHDTRLGDLPPTLLLTGDLDTLAHEEQLFADQLKAAGVDLTHQRYPDSDHGFTHSLPADVAQHALNAVLTQLRAAYGS